jgi:hypothetical protein
MSFLNSAGVYDRIVDKSFVVNAGGVLAGAIVVSADKGPTGLTIITSAREFMSTYGTPTSDNPSLYAALRFLSRAGILSVVRVVNNATTATGSLDSNGTNYATFSAANPGAWGNTVTVSFSKGTNQPTGVFNVIVKLSGDEVERFEVSRNPTAKNGYGSNIFVENVINGRSKYITIVDNPTAVGDYSVSSVVTFTGGANDTLAPTSGAIISAWDKFADTQSVPANILINAGWAVPEVQVKMIAIAEARKDAVAILDVPESSLGSVQDMITYRQTTLAANSYFGALYGGWLRVYDQYNDQNVTIPASGDVAAAIIRTIEDGERWYAPAGLQRGVIPNALGTSKNFDEGERDLLYTAGINPVTAINGIAAVIWGQKTLQIAASALDRLNVVNTLLWINQRMARALQPFVFEPNTTQTRDSVNFLLSSFLENVKLRGGLYDFYVDTSTNINTPFVIDQNAMYVDVYVKPVKTAEFIRLSTIVTPTGVKLG